jgi:Ca2+-binding EF-hand superfamily protein
VQCITNLLPEHRLALEKSKALFSFSLSNLFDMLDRNGNGFVDTTELLVGVHCISHGTRRDKLALVFHCFDRDGDGRISYAEMFRCFSTFLITVSSLSSLAKTHPQQEMYSVLTEAADEATRNVFEGAGVPLEDRITFDQFIDIHDNHAHLIP